MGRDLRGGSGGRGPGGRLRDAPTGQSRALWGGQAGSAHMAEVA